MKVKVDFDVCEGHGTCVDACPEVFQIGDEDDVVRILDEEPSDPDVQEKARRAEGVCPVGAIEISE